MSNLSFHPYLRRLHGSPQDDRTSFDIDQGGLPPHLLLQRIVSLSTPDAEVLPPLASPNGLADFVVEQPNGVDGFRVGGSNTMPGFNLHENGASGRTSPWPDGMEAVGRKFPDVARTSALPPSAPEPDQATPPQLSDWLYTAATMLRGAAPLPADDTPPWSADIVASPDAATAPAGYPEPVFQPTNWGTRPQSPIDGGRYARAGGAERQVPPSAIFTPRPIGVPPASPVEPPRAANVILAKAGETKEPLDPRLPQQGHPTEPKAPLAPSDMADTARFPDPRTEQHFSRFVEESGRATGDLLGEFGNAFADFGTRLYEDSILKARDDVTRLIERFSEDPVKTVHSILAGFPQTRIEGEFLANFIALFTILANAKKGLEFERSVIAALKAEKNTTKISIEGLGRSVPDVLRKGITEIKARVEVNNSIQLKIQVAYAKIFKMPFNLVVSPTTKRISKSVEEAVEETGGTIQRYDPATGKFTPYK